MASSLFDRPVSASWGSLLAMAFVASLSACRGDKPKPEPAAEPKAESAAAPAKPKAAEPPEAHATKSGGSDPHGAGGANPASEGPSGPHLPREELVRLLLDPKLASMTPEEAAAHYSGLGLQRTQPLPQGLELVAIVDGNAVKIGYFQQDERWRFTHARADLPTATPEEAEELYKEITQLVRSRLGESRESRAERPYLAELFQLSPELEAAVGAVLSDQAGRPHVAVAISPSNTK